MNEPSELSPLESECACRGRDENCLTCKGAGWVSLTSCPRKAVPDSVWAAIPYAEDMEHRLPPVAGGTLDQCESFLQFHRLYRAEKAMCRVRPEPKQDE